MGGHIWVLQDSLQGPLQAAPPSAGEGLVHVRVCVPPPQVIEHVDQSLHPPLIGQACVLQVCVLGPLHTAPTLAGRGLVHVRVCVPPPQVREQVDQLDHPPLTGSGHASQSAGQLEQVSLAWQMPSPQLGPWTFCKLQVLSQ